MIFFGNLNKVFHLTSATSFTVIDIIGEPFVTFVYLEAVWQQKQYPFRLRHFSLNKFIIQVDNESLISLLFVFRERTCKQEEGVYNFKSETSHPSTAHQKRHPLVIVFLVKRQ